MKIKKNLKIVFLLIGSIILVCGIIYGLLHLLAWGIYNSNSCKCYNIDNVEMRAHIDIPSIDSVSCYYYEKANTKYSYYAINLDKVNIDEYIVKNNLEPYTKVSPNITSFNIIQNIKRIDTTNVELLYARQEEFKNNRHTIILNKQTGELWVKLQYKD